MFPPQAELPLWGLTDAPRVVPGSEARRIALGDRVVDYALKRGRRRSIGLTIDQRGLRVGAPPRAALHEIETVIRQHAAWVIEKLDVWRERPAATTTLLIDGLAFPLLGEAALLRLDVGRSGFCWRDDAAGPPVLCLQSPAGAAVLPLFERALRERARPYFAAHLQDFCSRFAIPEPPLSLTSARTRWGSCSRRSGIRLNWRLIHARPALIDYVVAHELAHLKEMNHSPRFWAEVGRLYPDWQDSRRELRGFALQLPRFG